jgi:hypothetical protein
MSEMATRRRHTPEQIIRKLREADRLLGEGQGVPEAAGGAIPPRSRSVPWIVPGPRSSARAMSLTDSPALQRSHNSRRSAAV